ncbi:tRNA pseudouridine(38/39) synthase-like [Glandiceps talaboti]
MTEEVRSKRKNGDTCESTPANASSGDLHSCSKEELIDTIQKLRLQLGNVEKSESSDIDHSASHTDTKKRRKPKRAFDFTKYNTRHIALKFLYMGWDYHGFACQDSTDKTIEACLFEALLKTRLIEDRQSSNYSRCGRTDKGVSAFSQVISIDLRTNLLEGVGVKVRSNGTAADRQGDKTTEINYMKILNNVLPDEIRIVAWTPVKPDFDARFSASSRTYKYFFPKADLDIEVMKMAAQKLVGQHDFRNFCKMDVANGVVNFVRKIYVADIEPIDERNDGFQMYAFTIKGMAFLYHQVRCIVAILFLIGQHKEKPEIIDDLLDIDNHPCKPQYSMAAEFPLVLYDTHFQGINWIYNQEEQELNITHLQKRWTSQTTRTTILSRMLDGLNTIPCPSVSSDVHQTDNKPQTIATTWQDGHPPILKQNAELIMGCQSRQYKRLLDRPVCDSLESRIEHYAKKRRLAES